MTVGGEGFCRISALSRLTTSYVCPGKPTNLKFEHKINENKTNEENIIYANFFRIIVIRRSDFSLRLYPSRDRDSKIAVIANENDTMQRPKNIKFAEIIKIQINKNLNFMGFKSIERIKEKNHLFKLP